VHDAGKAKMDISSYLKLHHQFVPKKKRKEHELQHQQVHASESCIGARDPYNTYI
jgi:hypothetical protein